MPDHDPADLAALAEPLDLLRTEHRTISAGNRIVYQPMEGNDAEEDGGPSLLTLTRYLERANGAAGIDFVEALAVSPEGKARGRQLVLSDATAKGFEWLVSKYRNANADTPLVFQLTHSGRFAAAPVTPYPLPDREARLLVDGDMARIQRDLVRAVRIAREVGADGIDFKHCHGYLFGALLGPANRERRDWSWGGEELTARARFLTETLARMREEVPADRFLYVVRLSAYEGIPGGFGSRDAYSEEEDPTHAELIHISKILAGAGVRLINQTSGVPGVSTGLVRQTNEDPLPFLDHQRRAEVIKRAAGVPVVGSGYSYLKDGENRLPGEDPARKSLVAMGGAALREGRADFVGIGRQSLSDPYFARKLLTGRADRIRWDTSCNRCAVFLRSGIPAGCVTFDPYYERRFREVKRRRQ